MWLWTGYGSSMLCLRSRRCCSAQKRGLLPAGRGPGGGPAVDPAGLCPVQLERMGACPASRAPGFRESSPPKGWRSRPFGLQSLAQLHRHPAHKGPGVCQRKDDAQTRHAGLCAEKSFVFRSVAYRVLRSASHSLGQAQGRPDFRLPHARLGDRQGTSPSRSPSPARFPQKSVLKSPLARVLTSEP